MIMVLAVGGCGNSNSSSTNPAHTATPSPSPTPAINAALWVANGFNVVEFVPSQLVVQGVSTPIPQLTIQAHALGTPHGVAFDAAGNLWVVMGRGYTQGGTIPPSLEEFTSAELSAQPTQGPNVTIGFTGFVRPAHAVFDIKGDLWVSDFLSNAVFEYTPAQLAVGGPIVIPNLIPNVELTSNPAFTTDWNRLRCGRRSVDRQHRHNHNLRIQRGVAADRRWLDRNPDAQRYSVG